MTGLELQALRKVLHMTQDQLARELGVSRATIDRWEHGRVPIKATVARVLGILVAMRKRE